MDDAYAESYFSIHYNNINGNSVFQGMKNEGQSVNICSYDNGTSSSCENSYPSIVNNIYYDNGTLKNITNSPTDNDTRYFEEKINPMIGTTRVSFGIGSLAGIIGGYIGDIFSINYIFSSMIIFLVPALILAILLKKIK